MKFSQLLLNWYKINKRELPWRNTTDLYHIWVSEIIMQQTRVAQGTLYYYRFLERFPSLKSLVEADKSEVLKIWQGLGYYSRARNMHEAARQITNEFGGKFPSDYNSMLKIKGIGKYTAAVLLSFGYHLPYPVMDGNVKRFVSRYFALEYAGSRSKAETVFSEKLNTLFDKNNPYEFNQAIMEFGAIQCKPGIPDCEGCMVNKKCLAYKKGKVQHYPQPKKNKETVRYLYYIVSTFFFKNEVCTFLVKRNKNDIWKNLYEFPLIETDIPITTVDLLDSEKFRNIFPVSYKVISKSDTFTHKLSHQKIIAHFIQISIEGDFSSINLPVIHLSDLKLFPISRLTEKYLCAKNYFQV